MTIEKEHNQIPENRPLEARKNETEEEPGFKINTQFGTIELPTNVFESLRGLFIANESKYRWDPTPIVFYQEVSVDE